MPTTFATKPTLTGDKVLLRPFTEADTPAMAEILADPEVLKFTGSAHEGPLPYEHLRDWYATRSAQTDRLDLGIVDRASGALVGETVLNEWDAHNRSASFRILIGPAGRDRGLGSETVRLTVAYGIEELRLNRVSLHVYNFNPRAIRAYEKAGFVAEGVERESLLYEGEWMDATNMAVLARDWNRDGARRART
ncbi:GNAT family N-acetyltransferase [Streptomyces sp. NPDC050504]|uniref:GNAT family N-acetyltransferase n=1 Tax=Streptomyces sp. NPDC050504 TaxID=3365618 RepID=UPI0037896097